MPGLKTIYSRDGTPLTDIRASVVRSSLLNGIGEAIFYIDTSNVKCTDEYLKWGNYLYIQHNSLADWVGILDTPRPWHHGAVEIHAFEVPFILQYRPSPLNITIEGTPGQKFQQLLYIANNQEDTLIRVGNVSLGGVSSNETISDTVYSHIKKVQESAKHDWICTPNIDAYGRLTINMDWMERAGVMTDLELAQGYNIMHGDTPLEEGGELVNSIEAVSGLDAGSISITYTDEVSRHNNGLRAIRQVFSGITDQSALLTAGREFIEKKKTAEIATPLTVVDVGETFANIRLGNVVRYKYTSVGFAAGGLGNSMFVRVEGYRFDESAGSCELFTGKII